MATAAPLHGGDSPTDLQHPSELLVQWRELRYRNAALGIVRAFVFDSFFQNDDDDRYFQPEDVTLRLRFHVSTRRLMSPWLELPLSQLSGRLRELILDFVRRRLDLDDGYANFLFEYVRLFVGDAANRFVALYEGIRRMHVMEVEFSVVMNEPMPPAAVPQLNRVVYGSAGAGEEGEEKEGGGRAPVVREKACPICLQDFDVGEEVGVTPCDHPFHPACVARWLEQKPFCPICRSPVPTCAQADSNN